MIRHKTNEAYPRTPVHTYSAELKGPGETSKDPAGMRRFGTQVGPRTGRSPSKNTRGGARKPAQTDSDRFRTDFGVFPLRSKTLNSKQAQPSILQTTCRNAQANGVAETRYQKSPIVVRPDIVDTGVCEIHAHRNPMSF